MGAVGSFGGSGSLGMGVAFVLEDYFQDTAGAIERRMGQLSNYTEVMEKKINMALNQIKLGAASVAIGALLVLPFVKGIEAASDLAENINKTDVAFGKYTDNVKAFADKSLDTFGIDKIKALDMASLFGDMATGIGFTQEKAANMSMQLVGLAGDLASFKNISHDMAQTALKGIFTGETESLKNLGIVMTQTNIEAYMATQGINKKFKDLSQTEATLLRFQYVMQMSKNSIGDFARTSEGYANSKRVFEGSVKEVSATLGNILMPIMAKVFQGFTSLLKSFRDFANSKIGSFILGLTLALGAFLIVGGLVLLMMGGMRFVAYSLTSAFNDTTKAMLIETFATKGLTAGLSEVAAAAWAALAPMLPYVAIALAIVAVMYLMYRAFRMGADGLDKMNDSSSSLGLIVAKMSPIERFFTRIAGMIKGLVEVWRSWNGETFTLTESLAKKLEALGILQTVLNLATWLVRIKEFMKGVWNGMKEGFEVVWTVIQGVYYAVKDHLITPLMNGLESVGIHIDKANSKLSTWAQTGKVVGYIIVGVLTLIALSFIAMGISALIGMLPIILVVAAIALAIWGLYKLINWLIDKFNELKAAIIGIVVAVEDWAKNMYSSGVKLVTNLLEGIKSAWSSLAAWLDEKISALPIIGSMYKAGKFIVGGAMDILGLGGNDQAQPVPAGTGNINKFSQNMTVMNGAKGSPNAGGYPMMPQPSATDGSPIHNNIYLDGDLIATSVQQKQEFKAARK